ncbi:MAG: hypothetical protein CMF20_11365, partial [Idiomarinaceae bacterium]|nr:hypothetical protein [Idiomarinaceae bacterium]
NALAIRIIFPSVRVIQASHNLAGLPASLGKQKKARTIAVRASVAWGKGEPLEGLRQFACS